MTDDLDECLRQILWQPLDYLACARLDLADAFEAEPARQALNRLLLEGLQLPMTAALSGPLATACVRQWQDLPHIARLMGAQRVWPELARGARMGQLPAQVRDFARCNIGHRLALELSGECPLLQQVDGVGLAHLRAFSEVLPAALLERLVLLFPESVVAWQARLPAVAADPALFFLAAQHVRRLA